MKKYILLISLMIIFCPIVTNAMEKSYFTNENGVVLTENEYEYIVKIFDENFVKIMTKETYNDIVKKSFMNGMINIVETNDINPMSNEITEANRKIKIASSCSSESCNISVTVVWLSIPTILSYDVMGAYLHNVNLITSPTTYLYHDNDSTLIKELNVQSNGFGASIKLDNNAKNIEIYQYFHVTKGGEINASYQHAKENVSLSDSKKYTISSSGYGGVFLFASDVKNKYSNNRGVSIAV